MLARRNILLAEAIKTLEVGKSVGIEFIGDENEVVQDLISIAEREQDNMEKASRVTDLLWSCFLKPNKMRFQRLSGWCKVVIVFQILMDVLFGERGGRERRVFLLSSGIHSF
ncbi:hypothetical protein V6N12_041618 [Hibiscus sabdariffa]|uniref:Uncharacterized protein n=1 Tax=Hibiscus sabdariffa TaxID=183260 RepID=A0ABR2AZD0_9ROSI